MQEHPEQTTDEQLRQMLNDEQMHELVEQMAFTKRAFKNEETLTEELPIADEWEKFATAHAEELDALDKENSKTRFAIHFSTHKIAASFIGAVMTSGIALAAIHIVRQYQKPETPKATDTIAVASPQRSTFNARLEETDTLRFHFVWKRTDDLDRLVEKLNNFEAVNIIHEPEKLIVR